MFQMALTRALIQWVIDSCHPTLPFSHPSNSDDHEPRRGASPPVFNSSFPGILTSFLQSQFGMRSSVADETAGSSPCDTQTHAVTAASFTPAHVPPFVNSSPSPRTLRDTDQSLLSNARQRPMSGSTVERGHRSMMSSDARHARLATWFATFIPTGVILRARAGETDPHV